MSLRQWRVEKFSAVQGTLSARLPLLLDVFSCVLHRLAALHALGITHYDVKCDNVLLREGWPAALADYAELQHQQQLAGGGRRPASSPPQSSHSSRSTQAQPAPVAAATGMVSRVGSGFAPNTSGSGNGSGGGGSLSRAAAALLPYVCLADFGESDFAPHVHASTRHFVPGRGTECIKAPEQLRAAHSRPQAPPPPTESSAAHALSSVDVAAADGTPGAPPPGASVSAACGAPSAAAVPQHASGHHWSPGTACDIWSAGCLLYELLTGAFLFDSEDWARFFVTVRAKRREDCSRPVESPPIIVVLSAGHGRPPVIVPDTRLVARRGPTAALRGGRRDAARADERRRRRRAAAPPRLRPSAQPAAAPDGPRGARSRSGRRRAALCGWPSVASIMRVMS